MKKKLLSIFIAASMMLTFTGCGSGSSDSTDSNSDKSAQNVQHATGKTDLADTNFDTSYVPKKKEYRIYCTYKSIHSWYDAIEEGVKAAVEDFKAKGVTIDYEWYAPATPDAVDQVNSIETAVGQGWDLIAVDVNQEETTAPAINAAVEAGVKVCTFASSDLPNTKRSFFVGNTDNYADGAALAEAVIKQMGEKGKLALLAGTIGASSHEQRLEAFKDVASKYPNIEIVDEQRDNDSVEKSIQITESWMQSYPDLGGILCNNMSNPVGACQAVSDAGRSGDVVIGGMDHDLRAFNYLEDETLYVAQVQNCYDMGYKMIYNAVKAIDGVEFDEITDVGSTSVFKQDAEKYIKLLYK